jgi:hypothetical protein
MDKGGMATVILSISEPNVWFGDCIRNFPAAGR